MSLYDLDKLLFIPCFSDSKSNKKNTYYLDDLVPVSYTHLTLPTIYSV